MDFLMKTDVQIELENKYAKNNLMKRLHEYYEELVPEELFMEIDVEPKVGYAVLCQMQLHKRCSIETLVGCIRKHFADIQDAVEAIMALTVAGAIGFDEATNMFVVQIELDPEVQRELDIYQFPVPMVVPPKRINDNKSFGYLTFKGSIILKNNHHDLDVNRNHINRVNAYALRINQEVASMVKNKWKNLDKRKDDETFEDFEKRKKAFKKYDRDAHNVLNILGDEPFWLTHRYDKRGRVYCQGYHVTYQGTDWNKAVIEFADAEIVPLDDVVTDEEIDLPWN